MVIDMFVTRRPLLWYVGLLVFQWPFALLWMYRVLGDASHISSRDIKGVWLLYGLVFASSLLLLMVAVVPIPLDGPGLVIDWLWNSIGVLAAIIWIGFTAILVWINRQVLRALGKRASVKEDAIMIILTTFFVASMPVLQARINRLKF